MVLYMNFDVDLMCIIDIVLKTLFSDVKILAEI